MSDPLDYPWNPQTAEELSCQTRVENGLVLERDLDAAGLELGKEEGSLCRNSYLSHGSNSACLSRCLELSLPVSIQGLLLRASSLRPAALIRGQRRSIAWDVKTGQRRPP
jgi:hypothetical protein